MLKTALLKQLGELQALAPADRLKQRYAKFRSFGQVMEKQQSLAQKAEPTAGVEI
jgi:hypothetical protein